MQYTTGAHRPLRKQLRFIQTPTQNEQQSSRRTSRTLPLPRARVYVSSSTTSLFTKRCLNACTGILPCHAGKSEKAVTRYRCFAVCEEYSPSNTGQRYSEEDFISRFAIYFQTIHVKTSWKNKEIRVRWSGTNDVRLVQGMS